MKPKRLEINEITLLYIYMTSIYYQLLDYISRESHTFSVYLETGSDYVAVLALILVEAEMGFEGGRIRGCEATNSAGERIMSGMTPSVCLQGIESR